MTAATCPTCGLPYVTGDVCALEAHPIQHAAAHAMREEAKAEERARLIANMEERMPPVYCVDCGDFRWCCSASRERSIAESKAEERALIVKHLREVFSTIPRRVIALEIETGAHVKWSSK